MTPLRRWARTRRAWPLAPVAAVLLSGCASFYERHIPVLDGPSAKEYVYSRFADILQGRDQGPEYARLSASDRRAVLEILEQTKADFARAIGSVPTATAATTPDAAALAH